MHNVLDFEGTFNDAERIELFAGLPVVVISLDGLIYLKELAGRAQDHLDIEKLRLLQNAKREAKNERN